MSKGNFEQAEKSLCRIRNLPLDHEYIQWELRQIRESVRLSVQRQCSAA